jgi:hypothetical protein
MKLPVEHHKIRTPMNMDMNILQRRIFFFKKRNPLPERVSKYSRLGRTKLEPLFLDGFKTSCRFNTLILTKRSEPVGYE